MSKTTIKIVKGRFDTASKQLFMSYFNRILETENFVIVQLSNDNETNEKILNFISEMNLHDTISFI